MFGKRALYAAILICMAQAAVAQSNKDSLFYRNEMLLSVHLTVKPNKTGGELTELFKEVYDLEDASLPFNSFMFYYPNISSLPALIILHHRNCINSYGTPLVMKTTDEECFIYSSTLSRFLNSSKEMTNDEIIHWLLVDISCNKYEHIGFENNKTRLSDAEAEKLSRKYIKTFTNNKMTEKCNADAIFVCKFPYRDRIGLYDDELQYVNVHPEYDHFYTIIIQKTGHLPLLMHMYLTDKGAKRIDKYLTNICKSIRF